METKILVVYVLLKMDFDMELEPELQGKDKLSLNVGNSAAKFHVRTKTISP